MKVPEYITLIEASKLAPGRPLVNTLRRWSDRGCKGSVLQTWKCGGRRLTTREAIADFIAASTANDAVCSQSAPEQKLAESTTAADGVCSKTLAPEQTLAESKLDALGV